MFPTASSFAETWHFSERKPVFLQKVGNTHIIKHILQFTLEFPENRSKHRLFLHQKIRVRDLLHRDVDVRRRILSYGLGDRIEKHNKNPTVFEIFLG